MHEPHSRVCMRWLRCRGILPRAVRILLSEAAKADAACSYAHSVDDVSGTHMSSASSASKAKTVFHCSYLQVYNERVYDLLATEDAGAPLLVRDVHLKPPTPSITSRLSFSTRANRAGSGTSGALGVPGSPSMRGVTTSLVASGRFASALPRMTGRGVATPGTQRRPNTASMAATLHAHPLLGASLEYGGSLVPAEGSGDVVTVVVGLSQYAVTSVEGLMELLRRGAQRRVVRATHMNEVSSRSHTILQLYMTRTEPRANESRGGGGAAHSPERAPGSAVGATIVRTAKVSFVDLAGSERCMWHWRRVYARVSRCGVHCRHVPHHVLSMQGLCTLAPRRWVTRTCASSLPSTSRCQRWAM
ncbi:hypothetical protein EON66_01940 [archaeon]|nr:MAG: hypothetical protein EON66_01940 [archaeon]